MYNRSCFEWRRTPERVSKKFDLCYYCVFQICLCVRIARARARVIDNRKILGTRRDRSRARDGCARTRNENVTMMYVHYTVVSVRFSIISIRPSGK